MGCGAVCGSSSSIIENSKEWESLFLGLLKQITPNPYLYPPRVVRKFKKEIQLNPQCFQLVITEKLEEDIVMPMLVTEKWKMILYCLDNDHSKYYDCLSYPHFVSQEPRQNEENSEESFGWMHTQEEQVVELIPHKVFVQIEKDIERTFPSIPFDKKSFERILKRISNHFPTMGYTQGINFVVGYLLIVGYSEMDAFWMFAHLALNRRYLMLGLYQDGFPLINVYTSIFRNMLKRTNERLYTHLYEEVQMLQQSVWVFKWFMTSFLSSFPLQMCHYVWDFVLCSGGTGLIRFGVALTNKLQSHLLQENDACDIADFFSELKQVSKFNQAVNLKQVLKLAFRLKIEKEDLKDLPQLQKQPQSSFYSEYLQIRFQEQTEEQRTKISEMNSDKQQMHTTNPTIFNRRKQSVQVLDKWYEKLIQQRRNFQQLNLNKQNIDSIDKEIELPHIQKKVSLIQFLNQSQMVKQSKTSIEYMGSSLDAIEKQIRKHQELEKEARQKQRKDSLKNQRKDSYKNERKDSFKNQRKDNQRKDSYVSKGQSAQVSPRSKPKNISSIYSIKKFKKDDIWNDDSEQDKQQSKDKMQMQDWLFYMAKDIRFKRKKPLRQPNDILSELQLPSKSRASPNHSINSGLARADSINYEDNENRSRLARVGNSVLSNLSASNSNRSSNSSHRAVQKENFGVRQTKGLKNRTQENNAKPESKIIDRMQSLQGDLILYANNENSEDAGNARKRLNTFHDWMTNSQGPQDSVPNLATSNVRQISEVGSEVQIPGAYMFKKKNRANISYKPTNCNVQQVEGNGVQHLEPNPNKIQIFNDEESCESFFIADPSSRKSENYEIQSVK